MSFILNPYIHSRKEPNTFIGGVGATITNRSQLVAKLTGIVESDIKNFNIDDNNNVSCYIGKDFGIQPGAFNSSQSSHPTYFIHLGLYLKTVNQNAFYTASDNSASRLRLFITPAELTVGPVGGASNAFTQNFHRLQVFACPNCIQIGSTGNNFNFNNNRNNLWLYVNPILATIDGGNPDGDIVYVDGGTNSSVKYSANFNAPQPISAVSFDVVMATYLKISWSDQTHSNSIDWQLIFLNGNYIGRVVGGVEEYAFTGLTPNTEYEVKILTIDQSGNSSLFSKVFKQTTASAPVFLDNLVSYWDLRTNANDQWGNNKGTATGVNFVSGGIAGNCADFGSGTSNNITVADDDTLSFGNGTTDVPCSFNMWVNFSDLSPNLQTFFQKRDSGDIEYNFIKVDNNTFRLSLFDATTSNRIGQDVTISISANTWYMVTLVYDGINQPTVYVNASNTGASNNDIGTYVAMHNTDAPLVFGKIEFNTNNSLNGKMCEISIWKKALTAGEISDIYSKNINGDGLLD